MAQAEKRAAKALPYRPSDRIRIEHPKTGEAYGVTGGDFSKHYKASGFRAVSFETGAPFRETKAEQAAAEQSADAEASAPVAAAEATSPDEEGVG